MLAHRGLNFNFSQKILAKTKNLAPVRARAPTDRNPTNPFWLFQGHNLTPEDKEKIIRLSHNVIQNEDYTPPNDNHHEITRVIHSEIDLKNMIARIASKGRQFKIQLDFAVITSKDDRPSLYLTKEFFPTGPFPVLKQSDIDTLLKSIIVDKITKSFERPASGIQVLGVIQVKIYIDYLNNPLRDFYVNIPEILRKSKAIKTFSSEKFEGKYSKFCWFFFMACGEEPTFSKFYQIKNKAVELFRSSFYDPIADENLDEAIDRFGGMDKFNIPEWEKMNKKNYVLYEYENDDGEKLEVSPYYYPVVFNESWPTVYGLVIENHVMYISNMDALIKSYQCSKCGCSFERQNHQMSHQRICKEEKEDIFRKSHLYAAHESVLTKIGRKYDLELPFRPIKNFLCWDIEAFQQTNIVVATADEINLETTTFTKTQQLASISAVYSRDNSSKWFCIDDYKTPFHLLEDFFGFLRICQENHKEEMKIQFKEYFDAIENEINAWNHLINLYKNDEELQKRAKIKVVYHQKNLKDLEDYLYNLPIIGFNSSRYDLPAVLHDGFIAAMLKWSKERGEEEKNYRTIKCGMRNFKQIRNGRFDFLDLINYIAAGIPLDTLLKQYLGTKKMFFPYESLKSVDDLKRTDRPTKEMFFSQLKNKDMSDEDYELFCSEWEQGGKNGVFTWKDYLKIYNESDVFPMVEVIKIMMDYYTTFDIDMFKNGVGVPSLSEQICLKKAHSHYQNTNIPEELNGVQRNYHKVINSVNQFKITQYKEQDKNAAGRLLRTSKGIRFPDNYISLQIVREMIANQKGACIYCHCELTAENYSVDRKNNRFSHTKNNCVISCSKCNIERADKYSFSEFKHLKHLKRISESGDQIMVLGVDKDTQIEEEMETMKNFILDNQSQLCGGLSTIFTRKLEVGKTKIKNVQWNKKTKTWFMTETDNIINKIFGLDAANLYGKAMFGDMPCGLPVFSKPDETTIEMIKTGQLFGFINCRVEVKEEHYELIQKMPVLCEHREIGEDDRSEETNRVMIVNKRKLSSKSKKLVGVMKQTKTTWQITPVLKWLLEHDYIEIKEIIEIAEFKRGQPWKDFVQFCSDGRKQADLEGNKPAEQFYKTISNSNYGRTIMNSSKFMTTEIVSDVKTVIKSVNKKNFHSLKVYNHDESSPSYVLTKNKTVISHGSPVHAGNWILQMSKLVIYEFVYDFLYKFFSPEMIIFCFQDTDSIYFGISGGHHTGFDASDLDSYVINHEGYQEAKAKFIVNPDILGDKRVAGKMNLEWMGDKFIGLSAKCYYKIDDGKKGKGTLKGVNQNRNQQLMNFEKYNETLMNDKIFYAINAGIRMDDKIMGTYIMKKVGLSSLYDKRWVFDDKITTACLI